MGRRASAHVQAQNASGKTPHPWGKNATQACAEEGMGHAVQESCRDPIRNVQFSGKTIKQCKRHSYWKLLLKPAVGPRLETFLNKCIYAFLTVIMLISETSVT